MAEAAIQPLSVALDEVVAAAANSFAGVGSGAELHGHDLFHGTEHWTALKAMPRARIGVYAAALRAIAAHEVAIIMRGLDRLAQAQRYSYVQPPHEVVLAHLLEQVDRYGERKGERVLVIADEIHDKDVHQGDLHLYQTHRTSGYRSRKIVNVVDTIHFSPSKASRLIQAADLVAFLHHRIEVHGYGSDAKAARANRMLQGIVASKTEHQWTWVP